jgi:hypothetical protein
MNMTYKISGAETPESLFQNGVYDIKGAEICFNSAKSPYSYYTIGYITPGFTGADSINSPPLITCCPNSSCVTGGASLCKYPTNQQYQARLFYPRFNTTCCLFNKHG